MSHFSRIKTQMVEKAYVIQALDDLGYSYEEGDVKIRGFGLKRTKADIKIHTKSRGYDIGFRKTEDAYEVVADWWGVKDITRKKFVQQVTQRYAYHAALAKLAAQGFDLVNEAVEEGNQIHLVLRRMV